MLILTSCGFGEPKLGTNLGGENTDCRGLCFCWNAVNGIVSLASLLWRKNN